MDISIEGLGKRFDQGFVLRHLNLHIPSGTKLGIKGINGSGKSTLLGIIQQEIISTEGDIKFRIKGENIKINDLSHKYIAFSGPYHILPDEFTLKEIKNLYAKTKWSEVDSEDFWKSVGLADRKDSIFVSLSSGMQQRFKLALTIFSDAELYIFDEPGNYLDSFWRESVYKLMSTKLVDKTVIIASNEEADFSFCSRFYSLSK